MPSADPTAFDGPHPDCLCGHSLRAHRSKVFNGKVIPFCVRCEECNGFGIIAPAVPWSLLIDGEELDEEAVASAPR